MDISRLSRFGNERHWLAISDTQICLLARDVVYYTVNMDPTNNKPFSVDPDGGPYTSVGNSITLADATYRILEIEHIEKINVKTTLFGEEYDLEIMLHVERVRVREKAPLLSNYVD